MKTKRVSNSKIFEETFATLPYMTHLRVERLGGTVSVSIIDDESMKKLSQAISTSFHNISYDQKFLQALEEALERYRQLKLKEKEG